MSFRIALHSAVVALSITVLTDAASAQSQGTSQQRNACMGDAFRFCMTSIPNHKRIEACLRTARRSLSKACYAEIYDDEPAPPKRAANQVVQGGAHAPE